MRARYVILANGILTSPKLARIEGMETFQGEAFHTSRWNYDVTLEGKRVGIIGTGATAVQVIPELAKIASELYVFQRTPSTIDVRDQRETTDEEIETWAQRARLGAGPPGPVRQDLRRPHGDQGQRRLPRRQGRRLQGAQGARARLSPEELVQKQLDTNFRIMEQIRARVDAIVEDPKTAEALKPYYPYGCKRPTFHDEYLPTFNLPHVHLVDTAPLGVSEINENGVVHDGVEYPLDVLIYATGFQWMATSTFNMVAGRDGRTLSEKWQTEGTKTFLGLHSQGFPNLFIVTGPQGGGGSFNFTDAIDHAWRLRRVDAVDDARPAASTSSTSSRQPEDEYAEHCRLADIGTAPLRDCLSYYNGHGEAEPGSLAYYGGGRWHKYRRRAQETMEPYVFGVGRRHRQRLTRRAGGRQSRGAEPHVVVADPAVVDRQLLAGDDGAQRGEDQRRGDTGGQDRHARRPAAASEAAMRLVVVGAGVAARRVAGVVEQRAPPERQGVGREVGVDVPLEDVPAEQVVPVALLAGDQQHRADLDDRADREVGVGEHAPPVARRGTDVDGGGRGRGAHAGHLTRDRPPGHTAVGPAGGAPVEPGSRP